MIWIQCNTNWFQDSQSFICDHIWGHPTRTYYKSTGVLAYIEAILTSTSYILAQDDYKSNHSASVLCFGFCHIYGAWGLGREGLLRWKRKVQAWMQHKLWASKQVLLRHCEIGRHGLCSPYHDLRGGEGIKCSKNLFSFNGLQQLSASRREKIRR